MLGRWWMSWLMVVVLGCCEARGGSSWGEGTLVIGGLGDRWGSGMVCSVA